MVRPSSSTASLHSARRRSLHTNDKAVPTVWRCVIQFRMARCDRWVGNDILEETVMAFLTLLSQLSERNGNCDGHSKLCRSATSIVTIILNDRFAPKEAGQFTNYLPRYNTVDRLRLFTAWPLKADKHQSFKLESSPRLGYAREVRF